MSDDPYKYFRIEAAELVEQMAQAVLALDKELSSADLVAKLLRCAHTLKGAARVVGQIDIANAAHAIEDLLTPHRGLSTRVPSECADSALKQLDSIVTLIKSLSDPTPVHSGRALSHEPAPTVRAEVAEVDGLLDGLAEGLAELTALRKSVGGLARVRELVDLLGRQLAAPRRSDTRQLGVAVERAQSVSDELAETFRRLDRDLLGGVERVGRELGQVHAAAERLRLVPVATVFTSLERAVRDAAQELGKRVSFEARGGDVRLDGHVLAIVQDALFHVVRNSVAHGIEHEPERRTAGKPAAGSVRMEATRRGRRVAFACHDDGRGLDTAAVRRALTRKGRHATLAEGLGEQQLIELLLRGGLSTSGAVTNLSGRGIGLDVLREAAERLGGKVRVETRAGVGFSVELDVPLSVAAVEGLAVESSGTIATVPLDAIVRTARFRSSDIARTADGEAVLHEGKLTPFTPLGPMLGTRAPRTQEVRSAVVVRGATGCAALAVDRVLGTRTVVLREIPESAVASPVVAGAALDAHGNPELVLDADGLVAEARRASTIVRDVGARLAPILVIDDSLTTRMLEQSILESAGYQVELATSGEEGLTRARAKRYGLFLVDVEMPGIDGFTFIERTRADPLLASIPSVLVSSRGAPEDLVRGKGVGARGYMVKDRFDQRELLALIERLVAQS